HRDITICRFGRKPPCGTSRAKTASTSTHVSALGNKVQNALDETRMLILGAQVLLGFQFQAILQPGFERLPEDIQLLKLLGLGLMLVATGLLIAPGAYHQIVEAGNDSTRLSDFPPRVAPL